MAKAIVIWTNTVEADFLKAEPTRLAKQIEKFYSGTVYIDPPTLPAEDFIEIQICEILEATSQIHKIKINKTCPMIFHYTEGDFEYLANYKQLIKIGTLLHSNYYFPEGCYYPYWAYDYKSRIMFYGQTLNSHNTLSKKYLCFNGRPDVHRWYTLQKLHDEQLLDSGFVSFLDRYGQIKNQIVFDEFLSLYSGNADYTRSIYQNRILLTLDKTNEQVHDNDRTHADFLYSETSVSLITETYADDRPGCFITEKSWKALANCHLPIWISQKGTVSAFKSMGYDVFDDIIDQSYDVISDPATRWNRAIDSLKSYLSSDVVYDGVLERLLNNQRKFINLGITEELIRSWL